MHYRLTYGWIDDPNNKASLEINHEYYEKFWNNADIKYTLDNQETFTYKNTAYAH